MGLPRPQTSTNDGNLTIVRPNRFPKKEGRVGLRSDSKPNTGI